jgi:hypothetical protein
MPGIRFLDAEREEFADPWTIIAIVLRGGASKAPCISLKDKG